LNFPFIELRRQWASEPWNKYKNLLLDSFQQRKESEREYSFDLQSLDGVLNVVVKTKSNPKAFFIDLIKLELINPPSPALQMRSIIDIITNVESSLERKQLENESLQRSVRELQIKCDSMSKTIRDFTEIKDRIQEETLRNATLVVNSKKRENSRLLEERDYLDKANKSSNRGVTGGTKDTSYLTLPPRYS